MASRRHLRGRDVKGGVHAALAAVVECNVPAGSRLDPSLIAAAYFRECYRTSMSRPTSDVVDVFFAIFGHHPVWMKLMLAARNRLALWGGLDAPKPMDIFNVERKSSYVVGDVIGVWPLLALTESELIAGRDNKHLDFRVSILKKTIGKNGAVIFVSTICVVHNWFGKTYLFFVLPFHRWGLKRLIARARGLGRL
jgi:Protein of unknown function (DUF2867)